MENQRYRAFSLVLYPQDEKHQKALEFIQSNYEYAMICHDRDIQEDGTIKKIHYHVVIRFSNGRSLGAIANELGIATNYIEPCKKNYKLALLYLIHHDSVCSGKIPYKVEDVTGILRDKLIKELQSREVEDDQVLTIIDLLDKCQVVTLRDFIKLICQNGLYSYFRRSQYTFIQLLKEHNTNV